MGKYIFIDIDGTLHDDIYGIPDSAVYAIQTARKNGHKVFLSTGRGKYEVGKEFHDIGFDGAIYYAGGLTELADQKLNAVTFSKEEIRFFLNLFNREDVGFNLEGLNGSYMDPFGQECIIHFYFESVMSYKDSLEYLKKSNMVSIEEMGEEICNISKITLFSKNHELIRLWQKEFHDSYKFTVFEQPGRDIAYCELTYKDTSKASAVDTILKACGGELKDTIAFGDSMNDYEILQHCRLGIAMGNGTEALKKVADDVTDSVLENGIYNSFIKYHLIEPKK